MNKKYRDINNDMCMNSMNQNEIKNDPRGDS